MTEQEASDLLDENDRYRGAAVRWHTKALIAWEAEAHMTIERDHYKEQASQASAALWDCISTLEACLLVAEEHGLSAHAALIEKRIKAAREAVF